MSTSVQVPSQSPEALFAAISSAEPVLRAEAVGFDDARQLSDAAVAALRQSGVFRFAMPKAWGGPEHDPVTQLRAVEAVSRIDGAAGWCAMIGSDGAYVTAFLEDSLGREMYADLDASTVFVIGPGGRAVPAEGGYSVTGQWAFASGSPHAEWFALACLVLGESGMRMAQAGLPELRVCVLHRSEVEVLDTWYTTGVRGSGSNDVAATSVFVPDKRTFSFNNGPILREGPLYAWRMMFITNMSGVAIGIAQGAFDEVVALAQTRTTALRTPLREEPWFSASLGEAAALIGSARAFAESELSAVWNGLLEGSRPSGEMRARQRVSMTHAYDSCTRAVDLLYRVAGSSALYTRRSGLDRRLRDIHTISQHVAVGLKTYASAGRILAGLEPDPLF